MTLIRLTEIIGDRIELCLTDMNEKERTIENEHTSLILEGAKHYINASGLTLRAEKLAAQNKSLEESVVMRLIKGA